MAEDETRPYFLYLRKSVGRAGIARQRTVTTAHVERIGGEIIGEYEDADRTAFQKVDGLRPERARFDAMLADLDANPGVHVAAWHADRLTRNTEDTEALIRACVRGEHLVETPRGGTYDLATPTGRKRLRNDATDAIYEVDHAIERVGAAKLEAAQAGEDLGGRRRFGWRVEHVPVEGEDKPLRVFHLVPAEAKAIHDATCEDVPGGLSNAAIARQWRAAGLTTVTGRPWTPREVGMVLRRARNAGLLEHKGEIVGKGNWPEIVTEDEWRRCLAILNDPDRRTTPGPERRWLGSGLYVCGVCGGLLISTAGASRAGQPSQRVYRCAKGRNHVKRNADSLDAFVSHQVTMWLEANGAKTLAPPGRDEEAAELRGEIRGVRADLNNLADLHGAGDIDGQQLAIASRRLRMRLAELEERQRRIVTASVAPSVLGAEFPAEVWQEAPLLVRQAVVRALMTVTVNPSPRGRPQGRRAGQSYFRPEYIGIDWTEGARRS